MMDNNKNKVHLLGWYGGDEAIACSAWTSTSRDLTPEKKERIPRLIKDLWNAEPVPHGSPFEKGIVHFLVNTDIATHIHLLKHRISSLNAECLTGDNLITFVNTKNNTNKKLKKSVKELYDSWNSGRKHQDTYKDMLYNRKRIQQMKLRVLDESTGLFTTSHIVDIWQKGTQKVFKITLKNGSSIKCTENHSIYTIDGYLTISEGLNVGHYVGCNEVQSENKLSVHYSPIVSIEFVGEEQTYDIEVVGNNNNFVANNIVVHNSARYKELKEDKFYLPEDWRNIEPFYDTKTDVGYESYKDWYSILENFSKHSNILYHAALKDLTPVLGRKRAKESARFFKTYNSQIEADVMFNMRSFHNFLTQRMDSHAQVEIQEIAKEMLSLVKSIDSTPFQHTLTAWGY